MSCSDQRYSVEPMQLPDVPAVADMEREVFPMPWPASAFAYEVQANPRSHYFVARLRPPDRAPAVEGRLTTALHRLAGRRSRPQVVGYGGFWLIVDEAHISTLAVAPEHRRRGVGELLLASMIDRACELNASVITLETRVSNTAAQSLYRKYGFEAVGRRKGYYSDNGEDALIMTTETVTSASYQDRLRDLKSLLHARMCSPVQAGVGAARE